MSTPEEDKRLALQAASPEAQELLSLIFAQQEKDLAWTEQRLAEMDEHEQELALKARGERIMSRVHEILYTLYGARVMMEYAENSGPLGTEKSITINWIDDYLERMIQA